MKTDREEVMKLDDGDDDESDARCCAVRRPQLLQRRYSMMTSASLWAAFPFNSFQDSLGFSAPFILTELDRVGGNEGRNGTR